MRIKLMPKQSRYAWFLRQGKRSGRLPYTDKYALRPTFEFPCILHCFSLVDIVVAAKLHRFCSFNRKVCTVCVIKFVFFLLCFFLRNESQAKVLFLSSCFSLKTWIFNVPSIIGRLDVFATHSYNFDSDVCILIDVLCALTYQRRCIANEWCTIFDMISCFIFIICAHSIPIAIRHCDWCTIHRHALVAVLRLWALLRFSALCSFCSVRVSVCAVFSHFCSFVVFRSAFQVMRM